MSENVTPERADAPIRAPIRVVAVDLDGVVWRGGEPLPGVPEALLEVVACGLDLRYVTNNSTAHRETVAKRLASLGLPAEVERVLSSGFVAAQWLREKLLPGAPVMVVGEEGLLRELSEAGFAVYHASTWEEGMEAHAVVVGMDRGFNYAALSAAQALIREGALFVATNPDPTFPTSQGLRPGAGSLVAAVATASEKQPEVMGKPSLALAQVLERVTGVPASQTLFVGDRLDTDIAMGRQAGMITVLVLTGVTTPEEWGKTGKPSCSSASPQSPAVPHHVLDDLSQLPDLIRRLARQDGPQQH